jgi:hypothetical protein
MFFIGPGRGNVSIPPLLLLLTSSASSSEKHSPTDLIFGRVQSIGPSDVESTMHTQIVRDALPARDRHP